MKTRDAGSGRTRTAPELGAQELLDALPAAVVVVDAQARITAVNAAWLAHRGASNDAFGSAYPTASPSPPGPGPGDHQRVAWALHQVLTGGLRSFDMDYRCGIDAARRSFLLQIAPLPQTGGAVISHLDISAAKQHESLVEKRAQELAALAQQLQRTNEELDQFAYITSHDLKAPLRGIANLSQWIEEDIGDAVTPEVHHQMELLRGRVHRMESLIEGLLQYSRVGRVFTHLEEVDVGRLLAEVVDLLAPPAGFRIEIQGTMPVVRCERLRLQQVFMNLISNAIKHHDRPEGRVTITCEPADAFYRFCVSDDGPGIDPRFHSRIFTIFQTLQPRDQKEAAGVGLSLVKKIVEDQGGTVHIEPMPTRGACFCFTWARRRGNPREGVTQR